MAVDGKVALSLSDMLESEKKKPDEETSAAPKNNFQPYHAQSVPKSEDLEAVAFVRQSSGESQVVTTMMLRNIPNKYAQNSLMQEINDLGFLGTFDFFYLPMDVHNRSNVGYAFINFLCPDDAELFRQKFSDHRFQRFQSRKISSVCTAHVQGLHENLRHFENRAVTHARNDQYRPVILRNGCRVDIEDVMAEGKAPSSLGLSSDMEGESPKTSTPPTRSRVSSNDSSEASMPAQGKAGGKGQKVSAWPATTQQKAPSGSRHQASHPMPPAPSAPPTSAGRKGLENAIRDVLSPMHQQALHPKQQQTSAYPYSSSPVPPPGLAPMLSTPDAAAAVALMAASQAGKAAQGNEVMQLLSLRSLILDRLLQKDGGSMQMQAYQHAATILAMQQQQQQQLQQQEQRYQMQMHLTPTLYPTSPPFAPAKLEEPAYIELTPSMYGKDQFHVAQPSFDQYDMPYDMPTPRTNKLMLEASLRVDNAWKAW